VSHKLYKHVCGSSSPMRMDIASGRKQLIALACVVLCLCNQLAAGTADVAAENLNFRSPIDNVPQLGLEHLHPTR
jgi:hypothetical protein